MFAITDTLNAANALTFGKRKGRPLDLPVRAACPFTASKLICHVLPWQFFLTLTFRIEPPEMVARSCFNKLVRNIEKQTGVKKGYLFFALRSELGGGTGRFHMHALVGGLPDNYVNHSFAFWIADCWKKTHSSCGFSCNRTVRGSTPEELVSYVLKPANAAPLRRQNAIEMDRFNDVTFSKSALKVYATRHLGL